MNARELFNTLSEIAAYENKGFRVAEEIVAYNRLVASLPRGLSPNELIEYHKLVMGHIHFVGRLNAEMGGELSRSLGKI